MGTLFFDSDGGHATVLGEHVALSQYEWSPIELKIRPGEQWDPKCKSFTDGLLYMAAQSDFDGTKEYFDRELNKLIAEQYKPLCKAYDIPKVELTELEVNTAGPDYYDRLNWEMLSDLKRAITNEITATITLGGAVVDPLLFKLAFGLPVHVVPKDLCCQPLTAVPARPHKKKRIRKKWLKRYGWKVIYGPEKAWIVDDPRDGDILCVGPDTYKKLKKARVDVKNVAADD